MKILFRLLAVILVVFLSSCVVSNSRRDIHSPTLSQAEVGLFAEFRDASENDREALATNVTATLILVASRQSKNCRLRMRDVVRLLGKPHTFDSNSLWYVTGPDGKAISVVFNIQGDFGEICPAWITSSSFVK